MPTTSMPLRRNEAAAVEITALAAGAGPPANRIATRRIGWWAPDDSDAVDMLGLLVSADLVARNVTVRRRFGNHDRPRPPAPEPDLRSAAPASRDKMARCAAGAVRPGRRAFGLPGACLVN